MVARLGEQEGATARDRWTDPYLVGAEAALRLGSAEDLVFFLESGRAWGLREALQAREALHATLIPAELRAKEATARAREANARTRYERTRREGVLKEIRQAAEALATARDQLEEVVQRIQRAAKAGAQVAYPAAASLASIESWLRPGESLLLIGPSGSDTVAVVVEPEGARVVTLGLTTEIEALVRDLDLSTPDVDPAPQVAALRARIAKPLALGPGTTRLLVSPYAALSYLPFALLLPEHEVVYVASGSTYGLLTEERGKRGRSVLALGDPDYGVPVDPVVLAAVRGGRELARLPSTRDEARAVGDDVLLGREATVTGLARAVEKRPRWRAIHLACHALIDPERPMFSSLALTPTDGNDGLFTFLDVFRMRLPADLVVLSACETARGRVYRSEGILGLTRAFMFAGSSRALCSLWKVDDAATRALMEKFYALWNPAEGDGLDTAAALRDAQAFVRDHPKWRHPYYWAAWVLWGLPD